MHIKKYAPNGTHPNKVLPFVATKNFSNIDIQLYAKKGKYKFAFLYFASSFFMKRLTYFVF